MTGGDYLRTVPGSRQLPWTYVKLRLYSRGIEADHDVKAHHVAF